MVLEGLADAFATHDWMSDALCQEYPDVNFFPERGQDIRPAQQVCARCIVRDECLGYALQHHLPGIWGGMGARNRDERRWRAGDVQRPAA